MCVCCCVCRGRRIESNFLWTRGPQVRISENIMDVLGVDVGRRWLWGWRRSPTHESRVLTTPGGMKTVPPLVSVRGKARYCGEAAAMQSRSNAANTITDLSFYIGATADSVAEAAANAHAAEQFRRWSLDASAGAAKVDYNGQAGMPLDLRFCASMLLRQAREFQVALSVREGVKPNETPAICLSVPDAYQRIRQLHFATNALASLNVVSVVKTSEALATSLASSRPLLRSRQEKRKSCLWTSGTVCQCLYRLSLPLPLSSYLQDTCRKSSAAIGRGTWMSLFAQWFLSSAPRAMWSTSSQRAGHVLREVKSEKVLSTIPATEMFWNNSTACGSS